MAMKNNNVGEELMRNVRSAQDRLLMSVLCHQENSFPFCTGFCNKFRPTILQQLCRHISTYY